MFRGGIQLGDNDEEKMFIWRDASSYFIEKSLSFEERLKTDQLSVPHIEITKR